MLKSIYTWAGKTKQNIIILFYYSQFFIYWVVAVIPPFSSLDIVPFSSLNMYVTSSSLGLLNPISENTESQFQWLIFFLNMERYFFVCLVMFCWKLDIIDNIIIVTLGTDFLPLKVIVIVYLVTHFREIYEICLSLCVAMMSLLDFFFLTIIILAFIFKPELLRFTPLPV